MSLTLTGVSPVRLERFEWSYPGVATANFIQLIKSGSEEGFPDEKHLPIPMTLTGKSRVNQSGYDEIRWHYKAGDPDMPKSEEDDDPDPGKKWSVSVSLSQVPLTQHPDIGTIKKDFGGILRGGEMTFSPYLENGDINPFYNQSTYFSPGVEVTCEEAKRGGYNPSQGDLNELGATSAPSQFNFGTAAKGRSKWILVERNVTAQGNDRVESKTWRYGGISGWLNGIYQGNGGV